jgi:acetylornithine deacetylase/succinyl-diaminopimelate desuccinylase-like protein
VPHYEITTDREKRRTIKESESRFYETINAPAPDNRTRRSHIRIHMLHTRVTPPSALGLRKPIFWMLIVTLVTVYGPRTGAVRAQSENASATPDVVRRLQEDQRVTAARQQLRRAEPATIETQVSLCQIAAPPFHEAARGKAVASLFREAGLSRVRTDAVGNVLGELAAHGFGPHVVISAHLDTVFPPGTDVTVHRQGNTLRGPGIGDDCRGLAVLVALARVAGTGAIAPDGPVTFVATVGEEGLGDLRGARYLLEHIDGVGRFISLDGGGLSVVSKAVGSVRYKVTFSGPGGHSYGNFGMANPIHAMGRAISAISEFRVPADPRTTFNVGRVGGGTSVNAIAAQAWMEVDLRSSDGAALDELDRRFRAAVGTAVADENTRWGGRSPVAATVRRTGTRPTGRTADNDPLVLATLALTQSVGESVPLAEGSTDSNIAMSRGISAVTLGAGGVSRGAHSPEEVFTTTGAAIGTERALLVLLAAASGTP